MKMRFIFAQFFSSFVRAAKLAAVMLVCALYITAHSSSALAFGGASSKPSDGAAQLDGIYKETQKAANPDAEPEGIEAVQAKAKDGINEVQGRADADKMYRPSNSKGSTVQDDLQKAADSVLGR
jgi:transketolase